MKLKVGMMEIGEKVILNRTVTSFKSIKQDIMNAGANWADKKVVVDNGLVTSRNPNDLSAFIAKFNEEIKEGKHKNQVANA
jgi:protease I